MFVYDPQFPAYRLAVSLDNSLTRTKSWNETFRLDFSLRGRGTVVDVSLSGTCEAMDGRARAHMDVLVACPGRETSTIVARVTTHECKTNKRAKTKKGASRPLRHSSIGVAYTIRFIAVI